MGWQGWHILPLLWKLFVLLFCKGTQYINMSVLKEYYNFYNHDN